jgi:hypothetical protein
MVMMFSFGVDGERKWTDHAAAGPPWSLAFEKVGALLRAAPALFHAAPRPSEGRVARRSNAPR